MRLERRHYERRHTIRIGEFPGNANLRIGEQPVPHEKRRGRYCRLPRSAPPFTDHRTPITDYPSPRLFSFSA